MVPYNLKTLKPQNLNRHKISENLLAHSATLFGVKLGSEEIVATHGGAKGNAAVVRFGYGPLTYGGVETMYEIDVTVGRKVLEERRTGVLNSVPTHVRHL